LEDNGYVNDNLEIVVFDENNRIKEALKDAEGLIVGNKCFSLILNKNRDIIRWNNSNVNSNVTIVETTTSPVKREESCYLSIDEDNYVKGSRDEIIVFDKDDNIKKRLVEGNYYGIEVDGENIDIELYEFGKEKDVARWSNRGLTIVSGYEKV